MAINYNKDGTVDVVDDADKSRTLHLPANLTQADKEAEINLFYAAKIQKERSDQVDALAAIGKLDIVGLVKILIDREVLDVRDFLPEQTATANATKETSIP